jgi:hypothetical protein
MSSHPGSFDPEQEKIRQAIWRSEAQLGLAVEVAGGVGTWDWDLKNDLIYCNERFATLFSVDPAVAATQGVPSADYISAIESAVGGLFMCRRNSARHPRSRSTAFAGVRDWL